VPATTTLNEIRSPRQRLRARVSRVARIAVSVLLLGFIVRELGGPPALMDGVGRLSLFALLAAFAVNTADRVLMTWKWTLLLRARGQRLPLLQGISIYCASMVWGIFLPATMGADAVRAVSSVRAGLPTSEVLASIVVERALGLLACLVMGLLGLLLVSLLGHLPPSLAPLWWVGGLLLCGGAVILALSFSDVSFGWIHGRLLRPVAERRLVRRLREVHETYRSFRAHPRTLWSFWWLSMLEQLGPFLAIWILAVELGAGISPLYLAGAVALSSLVSRIPISLGGLGVMEGSFVFLLSLEGTPGSLALTIALTARLVEVASWLPWWLAFVVSGGSARRPRDA